MKLLWLCNMAPGAVRAAMDGKAASGLWVDHVLSDLRKETLNLHILCPGSGQQGALNDKITFATFSKGAAHQYTPEQEQFFRQELLAFQPEVIHIWGSEYGHTLAMVRLCRELGLLEHTVVSIQGLCSVYAPHYAEGVPEQIQHHSTLRDLLQRDNIRAQQKKFFLRGDMERQALAQGAMSSAAPIGTEPVPIAWPPRLATISATRLCGRNSMRAAGSLLPAGSTASLPPAASIPLRGFITSFRRRRW